MDIEELEEIQTPVQEENTENVEQTTEESPEVDTGERTYTEAEFNKRLSEEIDRLLPQKMERRTARIRKELDGQYGELIGLLQTSTGKQEIGDIANALRDGIGRSGKQVPEQSQYTDEDIRILARAEAEDIIRGGDDEIAYELGRLGKRANPSKREQETIRLLQEHQHNGRRDRELAQIGVPENVRRSEQFRNFAAQFTDRVPMKDVYQLFEKSTKPQKQIETMGSMHSGAKQTGVKDYYSPEEIAKLSDADLDNEEVWQAVRRSMTGA